jgi:hypothetical protein
MSSMMPRLLGESRADSDPVEVTKLGLTSVGNALMSPADFRSVVGADEDDWSRFAAYWDDLEPDRYAGELGTRRLRRYGHFSFKPADGVTEPMPHNTFVQPDDSNPLYIQVNRDFEPLTADFIRDHLLRSIFQLFGRLAAVLDDRSSWSVKVHPFRVDAAADGEGQPTPEGLHRDGVTLVTSLLVARHNAVGGESTVVDNNGHHLLTTTLSEPGTLLVGDDRRTLHGVSPIRPLDPRRPARRDVLVITFAPLQG